MGRKKKHILIGSALRCIAIILCIAVILFCSIYLIRLALESYLVHRSSETAAEQYVIEAVVESSDTSSNDEIINESSLESGTVALAENEETTATTTHTIDFDALQAASPYAVAWIQVSGIDVIDYPVVQYTDDSYFLTHSWDMQESRYGAIFLEANNAADFSDDYIIIYGHNMKNGSMFGSLKKYAQESFYKENGGVITIYLPEETRTYQIFSVRYTEATDETTYTLRSKQNVSYGSVLEMLKNESIYDTGVSVSSDDSIITLSTCAGDARLVVHAKLAETVSVK